VYFLDIYFHKQYCDCVTGWTSSFEDDFPMWTEMFSYSTRPHHFKRRVKSYLPFAGIIRSSPYFPR